MRNRVWLMAVLALAGSSEPARADTDRLIANAMRYDLEYPVIDYSGSARENRIWRLQQRLNRGEIKLDWEPHFGYLRALLRALEIDISSQILVFSKTSLQTSVISEQTPRAIYFNDDTYVAFLQNSDFIEIASIDAARGSLFFGFTNKPVASPVLQREGGRCLTCHDTYSMMGGGVPRVFVLSAPVDSPLDKRNFASASEVDDRTPIAERWGGWYLSGWYLQGSDAVPVSHLANLPLRTETPNSHGDRLRQLISRRDNVGSLAAYFDTNLYLSDKSDVVALLVAEHQTYVQNLITRLSYKFTTIVAPSAGKKMPLTWGDMSPQAQEAVKQVAEPLIRALFFADAVPLPGQVLTSSGFTERFAQRGPRDAEGRSLRELRLDRALFRYPLSYMIYTASFDALPTCVRQYVDMRIVEVLQGRDQSGISAKLSSQDRAAVSQILSETLPRFRAPLRGRSAR